MVRLARAQNLTDEERNRAAACASVSEKVQLCYDLMVRFRWQKGQTDRELAEVWGCSRSAVRNYSAEASHLSKLQLGDPSEHRAQLAELMYSVGKSALERTEEVAVSVGDGGGAAHIEIHRVHKPDHRTALRSLVDIRDTLGLHSEPGENPYDAQSLDELLDQAADYLGKQGGEQG